MIPSCSENLGIARMVFCCLSMKLSCHRENVGKPSNPSLSVTQLDLSFHPCLQYTAQNFSNPCMFVEKIKYWFDG